MFKRKLILNRPFSPVVLCFYLVAPTSSPGLKVQIPIPTSTLNATEVGIQIKSIDQAAVSTTVANVKKNCRLDELKDIGCCYCWAIEAHVHAVGIVVRNSELPYSYHLCPTMPYLLGFCYFLPRTVIRSPNQKVSTLTQITEDFTDSVPKASPNDISLAMWYVLSRGKQRGRNVGSSKENEYINLERPPATLPHPPLPPRNRRVAT